MTLALSFELARVVKQINPKKKYSSEELLSLIDSADCTQEYLLVIRDTLKDKEFFSLQELRSLIKGYGTDGKKMRTHLANNGIVLRVSKGKDSGNGLINYTGVKCFMEPGNNSICKFYVGKKDGISNYHLEKSVLVRSAVRLNEKPKNTQEIVLGVDSGSKTIGISATTEDKVLFEGNFELRNCL